MPDPTLEVSLLWRRHTLAWAARHAIKLEGEFVECACYQGISAKILCDYLDFNTLDKHFYLYDLFEHDESMPHHSLQAHADTLYETVKKRFEEYPRVHVTKGWVPQILDEVAPEKIAFMHVDLNNAQAETGMLNKLYDRVTRGGIIILDDYGWRGYRDQRLAHDVFFAERGQAILELPTGQGMVIKW